jgi:hypothetical protein
VLLGVRSGARRFVVVDLEALQELAHPDIVTHGRQTGRVISLDLARALRAAGLVWQPLRGDAFVVPDRDLDDQVFVLSDMVIEQQDVPGGPPILAFNGTTEWALDSLEAHDAVWLPREDQLRDLLGDAFVSLERGEGVVGGYVVTLADSSRHVDVDAASAYARALLSEISGPVR